MSGALTPLLRSPQQAHDIYAQSGSFPKQRHTFLVRFNIQAAITTPVMTYAVKAIDRPAIQPVVEEVNQYNKKRQVYTGYKKSPVKCTFYDDAAGSAQLMWSRYSKYYFGDFAATPAGQSFGDDVVSGTWFDTGNNDFGFTARNGGAKSAGSQWFFKSIDILHFHNKVYDLYSLLNPRIAAFAPDDLDYAQSEVGLINAEFIYEALIFTPNVGNAAKQAEFNGLFSGHTAGTLADSPANEPAARPSGNGSPLGAVVAGVEQLFGGAGPLPYSDPTADYRYYNNPSTGGLGVFGNFIFGRNRKGGLSGQLNLGLVAQSLGNPALAATLGIGASLGGHPLAADVPLGVYGMSSGFNGVPTQYPTVLAGVGGAMTQNYGDYSQRIAQSVLANDFANGFAAGFAGVGGGMRLAPGAYGMMNAQGYGSAQYGYNPYTTPSGALYGYQGATGVTAPLGYGAAPSGSVEYGGPYQARAPIIATPLPPLAIAAAPGATVAAMPPAPPPLPPMPQTLAQAPARSPETSAPASVDPDTGVDW